MKNKLAILLLVFVLLPILGEAFGQDDVFLLTQILRRRVNPSVSGDTTQLYVATTGNDANAGTLASPFLTITKGLSKLNPGETLLIKAGTYAENLDDNVPSGTSWVNAVTIRNYPGDSVYIVPPAGSYGAWRPSSSRKYIIFYGLVLDGTNADYDVVYLDHNGGLTEGASYIRFRQCEIRNAASQGILVSEQSHHNEFIWCVFRYNGVLWTQHGLYCHGAYNLVDSCEFEHNSGWGAHFFSEEAVEDSCHDNIVRNSVFHDNGQAAEQGAGIGLYGGDNNQAYNNVLYHEERAICVNYGATNTKVYNNTMYGNYEGIQVGATAANTDIKNNIVYLGTIFWVEDDGTGTTQANNWFSATADPHFVDTTQHWFGLTDSSACIDSGATIASVTTDIRGISRPQGSKYDVGAYEYEQAEEAEAKTIHYIHSGTTTDYTSLSDINGLTLSAGDSVLFPTDTTFVGSLTVAQSGTSGSPIVFGKYGTGTRPILKGSVTTSVTTDTATYHKASPGARVWAVYRSGAFQEEARSPNTGYARLSSVSGTTQCARISGPTSWVGGTWHGKTSVCSQNFKAISADAGGNVTFGAIDYSLQNGRGFFLSGGTYPNALAVLDYAGEWWSDANSNILYDYSGETIEAVTLRNGFNVRGDNITIENLAIQYYDSCGVYLAGHRRNITVSDCYVFGTRYGVMNNEFTSDEVAHLVVKNSTLRNITGMAFNMIADSSRFDTDTLVSIGMYVGYGHNYTAGCSGLTLQGGTKDTMQFCRIDSTGYSGAEFYGRYNQSSDKGVYAYMNYISNTLLRFSDGGGLYTWAPSASNDDYLGMVWKKNISVNCLGDTSGWGTVGFWSYNFYLDQASRGAKLDSNVSINSWAHGYFTGAAATIDTFTNNISYNSAMKSGSYTGLQFLGDAGHVATGNTLHVYQNPDAGSPWATFVWADGSTSPGTVDYNNYVRTSSNSSTNWNGTATWTIAQVRSASSQDANSTVTVYTAGKDTCFYNASLAQVSYTGLTGYTTLAGASLPSNTLTLEPMTAAILLKP